MLYPKIAVILDDFSFQCFEPECQLIPITPEDWQETLAAESPDFLFVESAWHGNNDTWRGKIRTSRGQPSQQLIELIRWCKDEKIPTVFWNKEDPVNHEKFKGTACLFDFIFTTDANCVPAYRKITDHDNIFVLPFAAQPKLHNPVGKDLERLGRVAFAGSWYKIEHNNRKLDTDIILKPALSHDLHIYDRMQGFTEDDNYIFPSIYQPYIVGSLPYNKMSETYKKYDVFVNINSVKDSPTMFSRRVFEILCSGTCVVSSYAKGIEETLPGLVNLCKTADDTKKFLDLLLKNKELRDRQALLGVREVLRKHTYKHRLRHITEKLGLEEGPDITPGVTVITSTNRPGSFENIISNYSRQSYLNKELVIILNNDKMDLQQWEDKASLWDNVRVYQLAETKTLGECLNYGVSRARFDYVTKFDDDNYYAGEFIGDLMDAFSYADAEIVGKYSYYAYLADRKILAVRFPGYEHRYVDFLSGSAMIVKKTVFDKVSFTNKSLGEDTDFLKECVKAGIKLYSADRFNYVCFRQPLTAKHSWNINDDEYLRKCEVVGYTEDFSTHVSV